MKSTSQVSSPDEMPSRSTDWVLCIKCVVCGFALLATAAVAMQARGSLGPFFGSAKLLTGTTRTTAITSALGGESQSETPPPVSESTVVSAVEEVEGQIATVIRSVTSRRGLLNWGGAVVQALPGHYIPPRVAPPPVTTAAPHTAYLRSHAHGMASEHPHPALAAPPPVRGEARASPLLSDDSILPGTRHWPSPRFLDGRIPHFLFALGLVAALVFAAVMAAAGGAKHKGAFCSDDGALQLSAQGGHCAGPDGPQHVLEMDVLEAFDALDHTRLGFIDRATVNSLVGTTPAAQSAASAIVGPLNRLFYADFRTLARKPGPIADAVMERASRRRAHAMGRLSTVSAPASLMPA